MGMMNTFMTDMINKSDAVGAEKNECVLLVSCKVIVVQFEINISIKNHVEILQVMFSSKCNF